MNMNITQLENKKSGVDLIEVAIGVTILGIVVGIGSKVLLQVRDTNVENDSAFNLSNSASQGIAEYGNWFKILTIVGISAAILTILFLVFGRSEEEQNATQY